MSSQGSPTLLSLPSELQFAVFAFVFPPFTLEISTNLDDFDGDGNGVQQPTGEEEGPMIGPWGERYKGVHTVKKSGLPDVNPLLICQGLYEAAHRAFATSFSGKAHWWAHDWIWPGMVPAHQLHVPASISRRLFDQVEVLKISCILPPPDLVQRDFPNLRQCTFEDRCYDGRPPEWADGPALFPSLDYLLAGYADKHLEWDVELDRDLWMKPFERGPMSEASNGDAMTDHGAKQPQCEVRLRRASFLFHKDLTEGVTVLTFDLTKPKVKIVKKEWQEARWAPWELSWLKDFKPQISSHE